MIGVPDIWAIASTASRTWYAIDSTTARARWARVTPRVMPTTTPRAYGSHQGVPSPVKAGTTNVPLESVTDAASGPISAELSMRPSPSRSHCTAAPVTKIEPSRA